MDKHIIKNSLILQLRLVITSILGIVTSRYLLKYLGEEKYGLFIVISGVILILNFLNTVLISSTFRFIAFELGSGNKLRVQKIFNASLMLHLLLALLFILLGESFGLYYVENILDNGSTSIRTSKYIFRCIELGALFSIVSIPYQGLITAKENFTVRAIIEVITALGKFLAAIMLFYFDNDNLIAYSRMYFLAIASGPILYILYSKYTYTNETKFVFIREKSLYYQLINFSKWILLGAGASVSKIQGTAIIVNKFFTSSVNATFGLANQLNTFITLFASNVGQAITPQITKSIGSKNFNTAFRLTITVSKFSFFLTLIVVSPLFLRIHQFLEVWLSNPPKDLDLFVRLIFLGTLFETFISGIHPAMHAYGNIKRYQTLLSLTTIAVLPISILCFSLGLQPSTILSLFLFSSVINVSLALKVYQDVSHFDIRLYLKKVFKKAFVFASILIPMVSISHLLLPKDLIGFILLFLISLIGGLSILVKFGLNEEERRIIIKMITR